MVSRNQNLVILGDSEKLTSQIVLPQMSIVSVDDLVSRPITVMNTIQEAVHVETRVEYSHLLRYVRASISLFLLEVS